MVDLITKKRLDGAAPFGDDAFEYDPVPVSTVIVGKESGGSGATGTAISIIELLISRKIHVIVVDLATTQLDLAAPYAAVQGLTVQEQGAGVSSEATVLRRVATRRRVLSFGMLDSKLPGTPSVNWPVWKGWP